MPVKLPALLKPGDRVALIAPSSPLANPDDLPACVEGVRRLGLEPKEYPTLRLADDFMAGSPKERARDVVKAFTDRSCAGVLCMRGGYSAGHILPMIDWKAMGATRRLFAGFSDITTILTALSSVGNLAALHAIVMSYNIKKSPETDICFEALKRFLFESWRGISYRELCGKYFEPKTIRKGRVRGRLIGGNVAVFGALAGTPVMPKKGPFILFLEDIGEKPYRLDRSITQLIQSGFMEQVAGVMLGQFNDCDPVAPDSGDAVTVISRLLLPLKIPILAGLPIGHDRPNFPLPIGVEAEMDAGRGEVELV